MKHLRFTFLEYSNNYSKLYSYWSLNSNISTNSHIEIDVKTYIIYTVRGRIVRSIYLK